MHVLMVAAENDALPQAKVGGVADGKGLSASTCKRGGHS